jgi:RHS repeat-associated protein
VLREKGEERLYSLADPNWNVVAICDQTGDIQERYTYDAFGKRNVFDADFTAKAGTVFNWDRAFTGQVLDTETGLMLYRNRYYSMELGRFVSRDPIGYRYYDWNLFRYVRNNVFAYIDSTGLNPQLLACALGGGIQGGITGIWSYIQGKGWCYSIADGLGAAIPGCVAGLLASVPFPGSPGGVMRCIYSGIIGFIATWLGDMITNIGYQICDCNINPLTIISNTLQNMWNNLDTCVIIRSVVNIAGSCIAGGVQNNGDGVSDIPGKIESEIEVFMTALGINMGVWSNGLCGNI